jgi:hypothetical protein
MYNPFPLINKKLLQDKIREGKRYFVRQTFARGLEADMRGSFLLRAYDQKEKELAEEHMNVLARDPNRFLYDATQPEDLDKLRVAASQPLGFKIYYAGKKGLDWKPPASYQQKMKRFIAKRHPDWRGPRGGDKIQIGLMEEFGALYLKFSFKEHSDRIPFDEIENY